MTHIALVDDETNILTSVSLGLESEGFEVEGLTEYSKKNKDRFKDSALISESKAIWIKVMGRNPQRVHQGR